MCLFTILTLNAQVPNSGFENWVNDIDGNYNPEFWTTSNSTPDTSVRPYTPAYAGNFSMQVSSLPVGGGFVIPGMAYINYTSHQRPTQMTICMRSTVANSDQILVYYSSWRNDTMIAAVGNCTFHIDSTMSQFHCLTFPITYTRDVMIPDTAQVMILAGYLSSAQAGTSVIVDEIILSGDDNGISETSTDNAIELFLNTENNQISIYSMQSILSSIDIYDITGRTVYAEKTNLNFEKLSLNSFASGIYFVKVQLKDGEIAVKKIVKE